MTDTKKILDWKIANESFALSQSIRPQEQTLERSFNGAASLKPIPTVSNSTSPVNSSIAPTPTSSTPSSTS